MAEAEAKVENATEVKDESFGSAENIGTDGEERWDGGASCLKRQSESEIHPAFADCVEVR